MEPMRTRTMKIKSFNSRDDMGACAAQDVADAVKELLHKQESVNIVFAAAPSQNEFLKYFSERDDIDFRKVNAFHMDEYVGLQDDAPQRFGAFLDRSIFQKVAFGSVHYIGSHNDNPEMMCKRYAALLQENPIDIVCMGIGENGHIAFNDPAEANFHDTDMVKIVQLDETCRRQQVNDGCFCELDEVPHNAITLTIPTLLQGKYHFCVVPGKRKAEAVRKSICEGIDEMCPASILRTCENIVFYLDSDSAALL